MSWKLAARDSGQGYYTLHSQEIGAVPVRLFLTPNLLDQVEESIYPQIVNAASFPGVKLVVITPDVHHGYGVPIGTVLLTDADTGAVAMGPVGYDICCGMMSASSEVPTGAATPESQPARTSRYGARPSRSKSCTVSGPSSSRMDENMGLSARNDPWAAMCASHAPSRAPSTRSAVALPRPSVTAPG